MACATIFLFLCCIAIYIHVLRINAELVLKNMNQSVNPCENFYDFVCGKSSTDSILTSIHNDIVNVLSDLIMEKTSEDSPEYLKKLHRYHKACMDETAPNTRAEDDLKYLFDKIGWPFLEKDKSWNGMELEWTDIALQFHKIGLPFNYFLQLSFQINITNSSKKVIYLSNPVLGTQTETLLQAFNDSNVRNYKSYMINLTRMIVTNNNNNMEGELEQVLKFEMELAKLLPLTKKQNNISSLYTAISVKDLESRYPCANWLNYLNEILTPFARIDASEIVYILEPTYFEKFCDLMTNGGSPSRVLANYAFWRAINDALLYLSKQTRETIRGIIDEADNDADKKVNRKRMCTTTVNDDMYLATSALYVQNVHNNNYSNTTAIEMMLKNIQAIFYQTIKKVGWLADETKDKILKKISQMDLLIGYPNELLDDSHLNHYYKDLDVPMNQNALKTALSLYKFRWRKEIEEFTKPFNRSDWTGVFGHVTQLDAAYSFQNAMYLSRITINPSLFDENVPNYMNYGMLGFIMGHEMAHSVSMYTRLFDEHGNLHDDDWWDAKSTEIYMNKSKCIIDKYNAYAYQNSELHTDGELTVNENSADITGLQIAYHAYLDSIKNKLEEPLLPGFEKYTRNQMFWIASGSSWCQENQASSSTESGMTADHHAPDKLRVIGTVSTLKEFSNDFNCKPVDAMNAPIKCDLW
ncbi:neprilysin-2-like [Copidosoma floridanum]|uniref:neprilysin-2-like n=1 Tax=Copidosoma floridanum TaxID=29053 RepID=UPI0006C93E47|nr:neprilysin-2-like [Copidosoma floridanum]